MKRIFSFLSRSQKSANRKPGGQRLGVELLESREVPAVFTVNTTDDVVDSTDKFLSLREAIQAANDHKGPDMIRFAKGGQGLITLDSDLGQLEITDKLSINGPGVNRLEISGGDATRVFEISGETTDVFIRNLKITHGLANGDSPDVPDHGGGILNLGNLKLFGVVLSDNQALGDADVDDGGHGGAISNFGKLTVIGSTFTNNLAQGADNSEGPFLTKGGAITFPGIGVGGGIFNAVGATAIVNASHFTSNIAQGGSNGTGTFAGLGQGGAIYNDAKLTVSGTSFDLNEAIGGSDNQTDLFGGAAVGGAIASGNHTLLQPGATGSAVLAVTLSTFTHNQAVGASETARPRSLARRPAPATVLAAPSSSSRATPPSASARSLATRRSETPARMTRAADWPRAAASSSSISLAASTARSKTAPSSKITRSADSEATVPAAMGWAAASPPETSAAPPPRPPAPSPSATPSSAETSPAATTAPMAATDSAAPFTTTTPIPTPRSPA